MLTEIFASRLSRQLLLETDAVKRRLSGSETCGRNYLSAVFIVWIYRFDHVTQRSVLLASGDTCTLIAPKISLHNVKLSQGNVVSVMCFRRCGINHAAFVITTAHRATVVARLHAIITYYCC